jgi:hypothetical protein
VQKPDRQTAPPGKQAGVVAQHGCPEKPQLVVVVTPLVVVVVLVVVVGRAGTQSSDVRSTVGRWTPNWSSRTSLVGGIRHFNR